MNFPAMPVYENFTSKSENLSSFGFTSERADDVVEVIFSRTI